MVGIDEHLKKYFRLQGMMVHTCNCCTQAAKAGGLL